MLQLRNCRLSSLPSGVYEWEKVLMSSTPEREKREKRNGSPFFSREHGRGSSCPHFSGKGIEIPIHLLAYVLLLLCKMLLIVTRAGKILPRRLYCAWFTSCLQQLVFGFVRRFHSHASCVLNFRSSVWHLKSELHDLIIASGRPVSQLRGRNSTAVAGSSIQGGRDILYAAYDDVFSL